MKKLLSTTILIIMIAVVSMTSCSPKQEEADPGKSGAAQEEAADETSKEDESSEAEPAAAKDDGGQKFGALTAKEYPSYADALKANEAAIRADGQDWQSDVNGNSFENNVLLYDLNGDGDSELIIMAGTEMGGVLHILTMKDGKAVECEYDVVPAVPYVEDNDAAFKFVAAGGGADYMIYSGKEKGAFYIAHNIWDTRMNSRSIKYTMNDDGQIKADTYVENEVTMDPDDPPADVYMIDEKTVTAEEGAAAFTAHRNDYKDLLMYNMKYGSVESHESFRVFQNLKTDKPLATGYDEVIKQLE